MKTNLKKLFALLLTLAMVLPMTQGIVPANAEETAVEELPTETVPSTGDQTDSTGQTMITTKTWDFSDESQLADFTLYQSADSAFTVADGMLKPSGANGEMKAILNQAPEGYKSVSVDMIPGESGTIYAGLYFGASNAGNAVDQINSQVFLIRSDFTGWSDAPNRVDIEQGQFNNGWALLGRKITESQFKNNLFSNGIKEPLRLTLTFGGDVVLLNLGLVSNSDKYVQYMYEIDATALEGQIGLRCFSSDTCFDNLTFTFDTPVPDGTVIWNMNSMAQANDFTIPEGDGYTGFTGSSLMAQGTANSIHYQKLITLNRDLENLQSISFDILSGTTFRNWGGISLYNADGTKFNFSAGGKALSEANFNNLYMEATGLSETNFGTFFNTNSKVRNPFNVKLEFADGVVNATVTNKATGEAVTQSLPLDMTGWEGKLGFWVHGSQVYYDNLEIVYDQSAKATKTYTSSVSASDQDMYTVPEGDGSVTFSSTGMVVAGTSNAIHYQKLVTYNQTFKNIKSVSYDMYSGSTSRNWGGISLHNADGTKFNFSAGGKALSEANFNNLYMEATGLNETNMGVFFNTGARKRNPINVKLDFADGVVNVTVTNLTTSTVATKSIALDMENWEGQIGFWIHGSRVEYRNLIVVCEEDNQCYIAPPTEGLQIPQETVSYVNTGYNFSTTSDKWKLTNDISSTPYTLEAWVKIPVGVADNITGNIIGNPARTAPQISMGIVAGGRPRLIYAFEDADLNVVTNTYAVDVDLRAGQWIHLAYTMDVANDTVICYINGQVMQTWTEAGLQAVTIPDHVKPVNMYQVGSSSLLGWVADVRMWDHPLTADEISSSMLTQYTQPKDGLLFNAPMSEQVDSTFADLSDYENTVAVDSGVQVWSDEVHEPGSYSMVVIPDQQVLTHYYPELLNNMYQWIADNREKENIQIVMNMGDMADNCGNVEQWERSKAAWELLPDDLPFIAVPGNHDYDTNSGWDKGYGVREQLTLMTKYFPLSLFENYPTEFGAMSRDQGVEDVSTNIWQAFEVNGNKYLVLALEYFPREDALAWANEVISAHADYQVIITTHCNLTTEGVFAKNNMWKGLVSKHENVIMTMSGHCDSKHIVRRIDKGVNGNNVLSMLLDSQLNDFNKVGMLGLFRFNADGTVCDISYYSTLKGLYDAESSFVVELPKQEHNYVAKAGMWSYETVMEALTNANGETVKILNDTDEAITITADVTIDLAGCKLSNVTVAEGVKLNLIDSTADYAGTNGSATVISGKVESLVEHDGKKYMVIGENGVYTPHRYYVGITNISLAPNVTGFGYKAEFYGDEKVQAQVANIGYDLWLTEDRVISKTTGFKNTLTLRLKNFMVAQYGETPVNAQVYMTLTDGTKLESAIHSYSMRGVVEEINDTYEKFDTDKLQAVASMIQNNATMQAWTVANIVAAVTE